MASYRPQLKTSNGVTDLPLDAETVKGKTILEQTYPVGAIYISTNSTSPASLFGGTWQQIKDTFILAAGDTYTAGATGGEVTHQLTVNEMPQHRHSTAVWGGTIVASSLASSGWGARPSISMNAATARLDTPYLYTDYEGLSQAHNNMPPYLVAYVWKRTA